MRIAYISYEFPPDTGKGGIGTYVNQIATAMAAKGFDIHVFAGSPIRTLTESINGFHVNWVKCENRIDFKLKVMNSFNVQHQLLSFNMIESPEIGGNAWEIKKQYPQLPLIVRLHAPDYLVESLKKKYIPFFAKLRFVLGAIRRFRWDMGYWKKYKKEDDVDFQFTQIADFITAPSVAMKDWVVKQWKISPQKINIIPNIFLPSDSLLHIPVYEEAVNKRIIFFGRLNVLKGLVNGTIAMERILKKYPNWQFTVIGDDGNGPYAGTSMKGWMTKKLKPVLQQVKFLDGMEHELIPAVIAESEIVLLPSLFESFSYTCAEAMASGKAIVGSNNGGMANLIQNEESGLLINPERVKDIYEALSKLINNNELRVKLSMKARERIITQFNAKSIAEIFASYYKKIVQA